MEKRLFLAANVEAARQAVDQLHDLGVDDDHIGVVANDRTPLESLPQPDLEDQSDVVPAFARGIAVGGAMGTVAGLAAMVFAPAGLVIGGGALAASALGGASFGAFASSLVGTSVQNSQLREFEEALEAGKLLIIAEVDETKIDTINERLSKCAEPVSIEGEKDDVPPVV